MRGGWVCLAFLLGGGAVGSAVCEEGTGLVIGGPVGSLFMDQNLCICVRVSGHFSLNSRVESYKSKICACV